jgi:hypothetical protein
MGISPGKGYSTNPNPWKFRFHLAQDTMSTTAEMREFEINPTIAAGKFDIDFPPGTEVSDTIRGKHFMTLAGGRTGSVRLNLDGTLCETEALSRGSKYRWIALGSMLLLIVALLTTLACRRYCTASH